jgi:hypothetical protein
LLALKNPRAANSRQKIRHVCDDFWIAETNKNHSYSESNTIEFMIKLFSFSVLKYSAILFSIVFFHTNLNASPIIGSLELEAVDANGNSISQFIPGQYIRLNASVTIKDLPKNANAKITISALYATVVLGKKVSYSFALPAIGSASSRLNPVEGTTDYGLPLGNELQNNSFNEVIDFQIPSQVPAGTLTFTVTATATSVKQIKRKFRFNIVR